MQIDFLFDFSSPNAYLAHKMVAGIEARTKQTITYVPCLLGGIFKATNNQSPLQTNAKIANKIAYDWMDFKRFVKRNALDDFHFNTHFPLNSLFLMRAAIAEQNRGALNAFVDVGMRLAWEQDLNVHDTDATIDALNKAGYDGAALFEESQSSEIKAQLFENTNAAVARGAFGMPTFYVEDAMFFGKERLHDVEQEIIARL